MYLGRGSGLPFFIQCDDFKTLSVFWHESIILHNLAILLLYTTFIISAWGSVLTRK